MSNSYIKKNIVTKVEFAVEPGELQTIEGLIKYQIGDALITGVKEERWPIKRLNFEKSYQPIYPSVMGQSGNYLKIKTTVEARQTKSKETIEISGGQLDAKKGDWIVTSPDGSQWVVDNNIFSETYQKIEE